TRRTNHAGPCPSRPRSSRPCPCSGLRWSSGSPRSRPGSERPPACVRPSSRPLHGWPFHGASRRPVRRWPSKRRPSRFARITDNDRFSSRRRIGAWPSRASTNESRDTFRTGPRGVKNDRCGVPSIDVRTIIVSRQIRRFGSELDHARALACPYNGDVRKVVVTGGAGFIGSHLSERLLAEGNEVHVLDDESTGTLRNLEAQRSHPNLHVDR